MSKKRLGGLLGGIAIGAGLGLLFSPATGEENRKVLKKKINDLYAKAKEIDLDEVKDEMMYKIETLRGELATLDKEKIKEIALSEAQVIKVKAEELYRYAVEKGTPAVKNAAAAVKEQALKVIKDLEARLEENTDTKKTNTKSKEKKN